MSSLFSSPDRVSFAKVDRPVEGVPVEAFELLNENLTVELWARSPLIYSPVAMDFDAQGRLWLTEGIDYNQGLRVKAGRSIMVVEDSDGNWTTTVVDTVLENHQDPYVADCKS